MTSLTPTLTHPRDDTPVAYVLTPGHHVFAHDIGAHEADVIADLLEETVWRQQGKQALARGGINLPRRKGV